MSMHRRQIRADSSIGLTHAGSSRGSRHMRHLIGPAPAAADSPVSRMATDTHRPQITLP